MTVKDDLSDQVNFTIKYGVFMKKSLLLIPALLAASCTVSALPEFHPDSLLVVSGQTVYEYDRFGQVLSTTEVPVNPSGGQLRDILMLEDGRLAVYNGTFSPELSIFDGAEWEHHQVAGWSSINNITYGGIANVGDLVFLTDTDTAVGEDQGVIIFDQQTDSYVRTFDTRDYIDITLGADNLLYALRNFYGDVDVIDPVSLELIRSVDLGHLSSSRSVTANAEGDIFMVSWSGYVARYDANGVLQVTLDIANGLHDIDINDQGELLVGNNWSDHFYLMDESLTSYQAFTSPDDYVFVAFASPYQFTPPPAAPMLSGSHYRHGRYIYTTLNWETEAEAVDVWYNGDLLETLSGVDTADYQFSKKQAQVFQVCNAGTEDCSEAYLAN
jgi:hypothetical protein